jgi:hypothetical protein
MSEKINSELQAECENASQTEPHKQIPVIVTVNDWSRRAELEQSGLRVSNAFEIINAIAGTLTCDQVKALAELDQVQKIEFDGEVRAIRVEDEKDRL